MERRLAAIMVSDVVGYSRMVRADEERTLAAVKAQRTGLIDPILAEHHGRVVKLMGDGMLVEFPSVVDAVRAGVAIQTASEAAAERAAEGERIRLRIGINLGDVVIDEGDVHGDGVNVAARLESIADPGGVYVSSAVYDQVRDRIGEAFEDLGERQVKNIDRPVRVWRWRPEGAAAAPAPKAPPRPAADAAPSIVVLPFTNMSGDAEQEYFSDGIAEDIITDLSKLSGLMVIARNSAFVYKGRAVHIPEVCRELGVRFALEGSIRKAGGRVRVTAQLIDGATGGHLWAERYDRDLTDIFEVQDEVTRQIVEALRGRLTGAEKSAIASGGTRNVEAHDLFLRGRAMLFSSHRDRTSFLETVAAFERAIALDPDFAQAYAGLGMVHLLDYQNAWSDDPDHALDRAEGYVAEALARDDTDPMPHYVHSLVGMYRKDYALWAEASDRALAINPNYAPAVNSRALVDAYSGAPAKAIPQIERAIRLDPTFTQQYIHFAGTCQLLMGDYEKAVETFRRRVELMPKTDLTRALLASALGHLGEAEEARRVWDELMAINPRYTIAGHLSRLPFKDPADPERIVEGLRKAGIPE